jgi:uncharacterized protein (TIGR03032 family)
MVTTYQAGKLVMLRPDGDHLNTHFRGFNKPMGLAVAGDRLAIGTALEIWEYHNVPAVARRLARKDEKNKDEGGRMKDEKIPEQSSDSSFIPHPSSFHEACFLPRSSVCTGDIQIHEMAWATSGGEPGASATGGEELWFVNTRFSCLCTRSPIYSFEPRWRPSFISALAPEDRCHLNGLGLRDGRPRYVTALGTTDTRGGWRENKRAGGVLIDVPSGEVIASGLSMPHSPRWHDGRLWVLESGNGSLSVVDPDSGRLETVASLPGFTRGLDFYGGLAFIGLSQVRESAVFSGIAIAEKPVSERCCGVWVVDVASGRIVAFVKFEDAVQEIFGIQVLPGKRCPDLINDRAALLADSFVLPSEALDFVPESLRFLSSARARATRGVQEVLS